MNLQKGLPNLFYYGSYFYFSEETTYYLITIQLKSCTKLSKSQLSKKVTETWACKINTWVHFLILDHIFSKDISEYNNMQFINETGLFCARG